MGDQAKPLERKEMSHDFDFILAVSDYSSEARGTALTHPHILKLVQRKVIEPGLIDEERIAERFPECGRVPCS